MENPSVFLYGPGKASVMNRPVPSITEPHDVLIRIAYVGVCGSDVHFWKHGGIGTKVDEQHPLVMGHEASGVVHAIGTDVTSVIVGDQVAIEPGVPCRRCKACKTGAYNLCPGMKFAAAPPDNHGLLTNYFLTTEDFIYKIGPDVSLREAVLVEPLSVAVHAVRLVNVRPGQTVVVMGSGTVGLLCAAVARAFGAQKITVVDVAEQRLAFARDYLGCETYCSNVSDDPVSGASRISQQMSLTEGCDALIEASGAEACVQSGIHLLRLGGSFVQTGIGKSMMQVPMLALSEKELHVHGCFRYGPGDFDLATQLVAAGTIKLSPLISSMTPFSSASDAWDKTARGEGVKNLIKVRGD